MNGRQRARVIPLDRVRAEKSKEKRKNSRRRDRSRFSKNFQVCILDFPDRQSARNKAQAGSPMRFDVV